ncbi:MAG: hypothetical protein ACFCUR_00655 [Rhodomicrobiaceae bacterium]
MSGSVRGAASNGRPYRETAALRSLLAPGAAGRQPQAGIASESASPRRISGDLEAIPIPGHTEGSVAYLWNGPDARCLFTADSLYMKDGQLRGALLESSDREAFLASLARLRDTEIDLLVPWVAQKGAAAATPYNTKEFRRNLDAVIARIEAGGDG